MRVDQDRTGPLVVRRSASNERVMWITPDRVFYVGLLGAPSVRNFGAVSVYVGLDCPVSVSVDGGEWETGHVAVVQPYTPHQVAYASRNIAVIHIDGNGVGAVMQNLAGVLKTVQGALGTDLLARVLQGQDPDLRDLDERPSQDTAPQPATGAAPPNALGTVVAPVCHAATNRRQPATIRHAPA